MPRNLYPIIFSVIILMVQAISCQGAERHVFYRNYDIDIPADNYLIVSARSMLPDDYLVIDMDAGTYRVYSPYRETGMLRQGVLTAEQASSVKGIFQSPEYSATPERSMKLAMDAYEIDIVSRIQGSKRHLHHVLPSDAVVLRIISLYESFSDRKWHYTPPTTMPKDATLPKETR